MKSLSGRRGPGLVLVFAVLAVLALLGGGAGYLLLRRRPAPEPGGLMGSGPPPQDVVLITIDTLRADALGFYGNRRVETPHLDALAGEGLVFESAHASNVVTLPSHTNILTGLYPYQHGVRENAGFRLHARFPTLATLLSARGHATGAFVAAFPLDSRYGLNRGFDVYDDRYPPSPSPYDFELQERPGTEVVALARQWYEKERGRKRFLWVHLYDPHAPYRPPPPFAERYASEPYLGEVAATDAALSPLLQLIREQGKRRTLVIVTADHGEALGDHGEQTHGLFTYESTLRVPLLLWCPGRIPPGRTARPARHVDILPTVLELVGAPLPDGLPGRSLLSAPSPGAEDVTYFESLSASLNRGWAPLTGVVSGGLKYVDLPIPELYDLKSDPDEKHNLVEERRDAVRKLKSLLPVGIAASPRATAGEEARRLLALGYLSGSANHSGPYTAADDPKTLIGLDSRMHRVVDLYQRGEAAAATVLAREILRERPTMATGYEFLAFLLQQAGRDLEAARVLQTAIQRGLASEDMRSRLALILCGAGRPAEAVEVLKPLSKSEDPDTQNTIGIALADQGRTREALAVFDAILQKSPNNAVAHQNIGIALLKTGDAAGALDRFHRALKINEKLPRALNAMGVAQAQLKDPDGALASWSRAVELDPKQFDALLNLGVLAAQRGQASLAREALRRFIATAPPGLYSRDLWQARRMLEGLGGV
jgi:choline-sulfatase